MLSIEGVSVSKSKEICSLSVQPLARSLHAIYSPASTRLLPAEVVSHIIRFVSYLSRDRISQSVTVSHVCRQWRQIALSMPSLWTSIFLSLPLSRNQLTRTDTCILRSRNQPLDIYMDFRDPSWDWDEMSHIFGCKSMDSVMRMLLPQSSRWQSVELLTDTWSPIFTFLSCTITIDSTPLLRTVRLARCNEYFVAQGEVFSPASLAFPVAWFRGGASLSHLRHVSLSGVHIDWTHSGLTGLKELELKYHSLDVMPTLSEFRRILSANATLERLVILGWGPRMNCSSNDECGQDDGLEMIDIPQLKDLEIGMVDVEYAVELVSLFVLPKLQTLAIEDVAFGIQLSERQDCSRLLDRLVEKGATEQVLLSSLCELSLRCIRAESVSSIRSFFGQLNSLISLCLDRVDTETTLETCSALQACDRLEALTLKDVDPVAAAFSLSTCSFPPHLRVFLDIEDAS